MGNIRLVKYVFVDVVAYTKRTIETQCEIIAALDSMVKSTVKLLGVPDSAVIYIPTGDGLCISLIDTSLPFDMHITMAKIILNTVHGYSINLAWKPGELIKEDVGWFEIRIGINQSDDNLRDDINGMQNVTGSGINNARRIMDLADGSQILMSRVVHDSLYKRRGYSGIFREYTTKIKHGEDITIYQLVQDGVTGLNTDTPSQFELPVKVVELEPKLPKLTAYYFAHSIKNERFILTQARESSHNHGPLRLLIWFLAKNSEDMSERTYGDVYVDIFMPETGSDIIEGQFQWFLKNIPFEIGLRISSLTLQDAIPSLMQSKYFAGAVQYLIINSEGKKKLKSDWPEIWNEFKLEE